MSRDFAEGLNEGAIQLGDVVTFGKDPQRWVVEEVIVNEGKIRGFRVRRFPEKKEKIKWQE